MICPNCGAEIPDGQLICEKCGTEIKIVPNFDAVVDETIHENLSHIVEVVSHETAQDTLKRRRMEEQARRRRKIRMLLLGMALGAVLVTAAVIIIENRIHHSQSYYVGLAYRDAQEGNYDAAVADLDSAIGMTDSMDANLFMEKAGYQFSAGRIKDSIATLNSIIKDPGMSDAEIINAYQKIIDEMSSENDYEGIEQLIKYCGNSKVQDHFSDYLVFEPEFDTASGSYEDYLTLTLSEKGSGSIFYTLDGTKPTNASVLYTKPIVLKSGTYTVTAITINKFGVESIVIRRHYTIADSRPAAPDVTTVSGTYHSPTMIKVEPPMQGSVYYTTDGTDPTLDSSEYISPISMPYGNSSFRFATILSNGISSDIVECDYSYSPTGSVSRDDAPNYIIVVLIKRGEISGVDGTVTGSTSRYTYQYVQTSSVSGYGNFYIYNEVLNDDLGNSALTGRQFAVNISNGTVNLYSGGKLTSLE
jgi:hypothetical protein